MDKTNEYEIKVSRGKNIILTLAWLTGISLYLYLGLSYHLGFLIDDNLGEKLAYGIPIISGLLFFIGISMTEGTVKITNREIKKGENE